MIGGLFLMSAGMVMLYIAVVNTKFRDLAEGFLNGTIIKR